jgi:hypothetical protein
VGWGVVTGHDACPIAGGCSWRWRLAFHGINVGVILQAACKCFESLSVPGTYFAVAVGIYSIGRHAMYSFFSYFTRPTARTLLSMLSLAPRVLLEPGHGSHPCLLRIVFRVEVPNNPGFGSIGRGGQYLSSWEGCLRSRGRLHTRRSRAQSQGKAGELCRGRLATTWDDGESEIEKA